MADYSSPIRDEVKGLINKYGQIVRIKYYTATYTSGAYDDDVTLSESGTALWTSGLALPITAPRGSSEAELLEQGRILRSDKKLYLPGDVDTSGVYVKIGLGSPPAEEYSILPEGVLSYDITGSSVYKKCYIRVLPAGSFIGES